MNGDEITEYIQTSGIDFDDEGTKVKVLDYGFSLQPADTKRSDSDIVLPQTNHPLPSVSTVSAPNCLISFINALCPNKAGDILTDDVLSNQSTISVLLPVAKSFLYYTELKSSYEARRERIRDSQLRSLIADVSKASEEVGHTFQKVGEIKLLMTLGIQHLELLKKPHY